jgi:hypothetical protein
LFSRRQWFAAAVALLALGGSALASEGFTLGLASPGPLADPVYAAVEDAKAQGLDVKVVVFNDWIAPNAAVASGDLDANYYQHIPFLANANAARGTNLESIGVGTSSKLGLYSKKYKSVADIPKTSGGTSLESFRDIQPLWTKDGALEVETLRATPSHYDFNVKRCRYAETYLRACIANHRTRDEDLELLTREIAETADRLASGNRASQL